MDFGQLSRRASVQNPERVKDKAHEFLRLVNIRFPNLGRGEIAKSTICLDLACLSMNEPVDRRLILNLSGVSSKVYAHAFDLIRSELRIKNPVTLKELCVQFGCSGLLFDCENLLRQFSERYMTGLTEIQIKSADINRPVVFGVIFYAMCRKMNIRTDKKKIFGMTNCHPKEWDRIYNLVHEHCADLVSAKPREPQDDPPVIVTGVNSSPMKRPFERLDSIDSDFYERMEKSHDLTLTEIVPTLHDLSAQVTSDITLHPGQSLNDHTSTESAPCNTKKRISRQVNISDNVNIHTECQDDSETSCNYDGWRAQLLAKIHASKLSASVEE